MSKRSLLALAFPRLRSKKRSTSPSSQSGVLSPELAVGLFQQYSRLIGLLQEISNGRIEDSRIVLVWPVTAISYFDNTRIAGFESRQVGQMTIGRTVNKQPRHGKVHENSQ